MKTVCVAFCFLLLFLTGCADSTLPTPSIPIPELSYTLVGSQSDDSNTIFSFSENTHSLLTEKRAKVQNQTALPSKKLRLETEELSLTYFDTYRPYLCTYDVDRYQVKNEEGEVTATYKKGTEELVGFSRVFFSESIFAPEHPLLQKEDDYRALAEKFLKAFASLKDCRYSIQTRQVYYYKEGVEQVVLDGFYTEPKEARSAPERYVSFYQIRFAKVIDQIPCREYAEAEFREDGVLTKFSLSMQGELQVLENVRISEERVNGAVLAALKESLNETYSLDRYEIERLELGVDENQKPLLLVEVRATVLAQNKTERTTSAILYFC